ncbi:MAG: DUF3325 domain-containing protein [Pseudomonadota bacterium]
MSWLIAYLLAVPGFAGLCLSMAKHHKTVFSAPLNPQRSKAYRRVGSALIAASLAWCMVIYRWDIGLVAMCGVATAAALTVIVLLTLAPQRLRFLFWLPEPKQTKG